MMLVTCPQRGLSLTPKSLLIITPQNNYIGQPRYKVKTVDGKLKSGPPLKRQEAAEQEEKHQKS